MLMVYTIMHEDYYLPHVQSWMLYLEVHFGEGDRCLVALLIKFLYFPDVFTLSRILFLFNIRMPIHPVYWNIAFGGA